MRMCRSDLRTALAACAALTLAAATCAQPVNDSCANATPIAGVGVFTFDNTGATNDGVGHGLCFSAGQINICRDV